MAICDKCGCELECPICDGKEQQLIEIERLTEQLRFCQEDYAQIETALENRHADIEKLKATCDAMIRDRDRFLAERDEARKAARLFYRHLLRFGMQEFMRGYVADRPWIEEGQ